MASPYTTNPWEKKTTQPISMRIAPPPTPVTSGTVASITPTPERTLAGTMKGTESTTPTAVEENTGEGQGASGERVLPITNSLANFKQGLKQIDNYYRGQQQTPDQIVATLGQQLGTIMNPDVMNSAVGNLSALKSQSAESMFKSAMDVISEAQTNQNNYLKEVLGKVDFIPTSKEYQELLTNNVSPELLTKIQESEARNRAKNTETVKPMVQTMKDAAGNEVLYERDMETGEWKSVIGTGTTPSETTGVATALDKLNFVNDAITRAEGFSGASGRAGWRKDLEEKYLGATEYTSLVAETNSLRTNVLTMMTDPGIKKFFGPQMSEADVRLMTAGGTTLNPELQKPEELKQELGRLKDLVVRAKEAVYKGVYGTDVETLYNKLGATESYKEAKEKIGLDNIIKTIDKWIEKNVPKSTPDKVLGLGPVTGFGSKYWAPGLDIDLKNGDPVPSPVSGKVSFVGKNGGFGNQVRITTEDGGSVWLSHLSGFDVKEGDEITAGKIIGKGGNTGNVYSEGGGDGSHLDITVVDGSGQYMDPKEVYKILIG